MEKNDTPDGDSLLDQLRRLLHDGIDYGASAIQLLQAQVTAMALSSVAFLILLFFAILAGIAAFVLLTVALGFWLSNLFGGAVWAVLIIGAVYALIAVLLGGVAIRWLSRLKS